jgi:hypothetical protein
MIPYEQLAIMRHAATRAANGHYCGDGPDMRALVARGLMESAGRKPFVPDEYFRLTEQGREFLRGRDKASEGA